jgi:hypothetical protein
MVAYAFFGDSDSAQFTRFRDLHVALRDLVLDSLP